LTSCWCFWGFSAWSADIESTDGPCRVGRGDTGPLLLIPPEALIFRLLWGLWLNWSHCLTTTADAAHALGDKAIAVPQAAPGWGRFVVSAVLIVPVLGAIVGVEALSSCWLFWGLTTTADAAHVVGDKAIAVPEAAPGLVGFVVRAVFIVAVGSAVVGVDA